MVVEVFEMDDPLATNENLTRPTSNNRDSADTGLQLERQSELQEIRLVGLWR